MKYEEELDDYYKELCQRADYHGMEALTEEEQHFLTNYKEKREYKMTPNKEREKIMDSNYEIELNIVSNKSFKAGSQIADVYVYDIILYYKNKPLITLISDNIAIKQTMINHYLEYKKFITRLVILSSLKMNEYETVLIKEDLIQEMITNKEELEGDIKTQLVCEFSY